MSQRSAVNIMIFETNEEDKGVAFNQILPTFGDEITNSGIAAKFEAIY